MTQILHDESFQNLERSWAGLKYLVDKTPPSPYKRVRVMPITKEEIVEQAADYPDAQFNQSPLFKRVYGDGIDKLNGAPYACLVGDYYFDHGAQDISALSFVSKIGAASFAPFIAASKPELLGIRSWDELDALPNLQEIMTRSDYLGWNGLRQEENARYLALTLPRFLGRQPYGDRTNRVKSFAFEELDEHSSQEMDRFCWLNAAYAMADNIQTSFRSYGWCTQIRGLESGGSVDKLPIYTYPSMQGGMAFTCPTEVSIGMRNELALSSLGLLPLIYRHGSDLAVFLGAQTLQAPTAYDSNEATCSAELSARLPYIFACSRFAQYLMYQLRDKTGGYTSANEMRIDLQSWLNNYVLSEDNAPNATAADKAKRPLRASTVSVVDNDKNPGHYNIEFNLCPHYQLEGANITLSLVSEVSGGN